MGVQGYDWKDSNAIFKESACFSRAATCSPTTSWSRKEEAQRVTSTRNSALIAIQTPIRLVKGEMVGTKRLHDATNDWGETRTDG